MEYKCKLMIPKSIGLAR